MDAEPAADRYYRSLFRYSMDGVLLTAPDGRILAANPAACEMFGRAEEEICRVGRSALMDTSDPNLAASLAERERTGRLRAELTCMRADGTRFLGEISSVVFQDEGGILRTAVTIRDVTQRRHMPASAALSLMRAAIGLPNVIGSASSQFRKPSRVSYCCSGFPHSATCSPSSSLSRSASSNEMAHMYGRSVFRGDPNAQ